MGLLADWMTRNNESDESFALTLGISRVHMGRLRGVIHNPKPQLAMKIESLTGIPALALITEPRKLQQSRDRRAA